MDALSTLSTPAAGTSLPPAATRKAIDAYTLTVRSRQPSASRRIFQPSPYDIQLKTDGDAGRRAAAGRSDQGVADTAVLVPRNLSEDSARAMLTLDFPVPDLEPFEQFARGATETYRGNVFAVVSRLQPLPPTTATQFDLRI